ncbi:unnamed protein product [Tuber melanosporum]|uniref:(Perigord truffle) hypothetical protein n=1 Tax=Tuber melanosporum (strain Mel28) TaxID=656061 RepID=D5GP64_TUBMM|nr:uncharacterized protein GSTUM_00011725001 [Tuber melanosporum]CAZ86329.1 unnamed protein product [Tuber melanosporum]
MECPGCRTVRTPGNYREQALATTNALVNNFQILAILLDSASSVGQTEILTASIKDSLTSFSSCLPKVGGAQQLPQELVQKTIGVLDEFHMLSSGPPRSLTISHKRAAAINGENCEQSCHPLEEAWSSSKKRISTEFYLLASMQLLKRLKELESENNRHSQRDKIPLIAQFKNLVSCADPSGGLAETIRQLLSNPKYRGTPSGEQELSPAVNHTSSIWLDTPEAPIPPKTPHISPRQGIQQRGLGPLLPPSLIPSENLQACWKPEEVEAPSASGTSDLPTMTGDEQNASGETTKATPKDAEPSQPYSGLIFKDLAAINLTSFADLYKPILDYLPIRDTPKEDSPVFTVYSAAMPFALTIFWRNLSLTEASEVFQWTNIYRYTALDFVNSFKKNLVSCNDSAMPQGNSWIPLFYPRVKFIRDMHANFKRLYGESAWRGTEIMRLLNTCGTCRSLTTDSLSKPNPMLDDSGRPLLHFSIRFDGINVAFQDFPRQIVVPVSQTYTSPSETLIITPRLYDPHQSFGDLSTKTIFEISSQFSWLRWDQVLQGFLGTVPESLFTEAHTKATSQVQGPFTIDLPIIARTVTAFYGGVQHETRVRAQVKLRISKNLSVQNTHTRERKTAQTPPTTGLISESTGPNTTPNYIEDAKKPPAEPEHERCVECGDCYCSPVVSEARAAEDQQGPGGNGILVLLWGQEFKEWLNIVFLAGQQASAKNHRAPNPDSGLLSFKNIELNAGGSSGYPLMDRIENQIFRIGAELEVSANYGTHSRLHRDFCNSLKVSTEAVGLFSENDTEYIPSFSALGPIDTNGKILNHATGRQSENNLSRSSTSWVKGILQKVLKQLACFRYDFNETIKINIHVGMEAVSGYELREIKTISKAIVLFGGLLNGIGLGPNPGHYKCCPDPTERVPSNAKHIQAIDRASSIEDVAQLMNSLEASGYTYHGEPGLENQRYDFSCLEGQGVIIWSQVFPKFDEKDVIDWISMILLFNRTAIFADSSLFADLAEKPITLASLNRFIARG